MDSDSRRQYGLADKAGIPRHYGFDPDDAALMRCTKCGTVYPIVPYFKAAKVHGLDRSCDGREWVRVDD